ncbi:ribonuclease H-like domain-containing protein [Tanacetum coccineum]
MVTSFDQITLTLTSVVQQGRVVAISLWAQASLSGLGTDIAYLLLYVDDIVLTASSETLLRKIIASLHQEFSMTDLGSLNYFLGILVTRDSSGLFLSQRKYVVETLERAHMVNFNPCRTPVDTESKLGDDGDPVSDPTLYQSLVGSLQYLTFTRHDISYVVQQVCLHMHDPREPHFSALKRILRYVPVAKYCGVANAVAETCWLRNLLRELHTPLSSVTLVYCDNVSAVYLSCNPVQHQRTKHIEIDIHFVRDLVAAGQPRNLGWPAPGFGYSMPGPLPFVNPVMSLAQKLVRQFGYQLQPSAQHLAQAQLVVYPTPYLAHQNPSWPTTASIDVMGPTALLGQVTIIPYAFTVGTLHDPTTGAWNMDTCASSHLNNSDFLTRRVLLRCDSTEDLYPVTAPSPIPHAFLVSQHTWHQRLGHPGGEVFRRLVSSNFISYNKEKPPVLCHACQLGKHVRLPFVHPDTVVTSCFDIIHSDVWTSPIPSLSGYKYYVLFLDHYS